MARSQVSHVRRLTGFFALLLLATQVMAFEPRWSTYTSFLDVRRVRQYADTTYFVTSGGLMAIADPSQASVTHTNLDGLGTVDLTDMIRDASDQTWLSAMGRLIKFNGSASHSYLFFDNDGQPFRLHCIADDGDFLWLGTDKGLVLFSKLIDGGQIEDSYELFGNLNPSPAVYDVLLRGDSIVIATSAGVAIGDRSNRTLLKAPANWSVYGSTTYPELGTDTVRRVSAFENKLYFGTVRGLFRLDRSTTDTLIRTALIDTARVNDQRIDNDTLFAYYSGGIVAIANGNVTQVTSGSAIPAPAITGINLGSTRWIAGGTKGLFSGDQSALTEYTHIGLLTNNLSDVAVLSDRSIGVHLYNPGAVQILHPGESDWEKITIDVGGRGTQLVSGYADDYWAGSFGAGLYHVMAPGDVTRYDTTGTTMQGNSEGNNYIVLYGLDVGDGCLFASCYRAYLNEPIAIARLSPSSPWLTEWTSIGLSEGITNAFVGPLDYFAGKVAVATESDGLFECDLGGDPFTGSTICRRYSEESGFLVSNTVRVVKYAPDSTLWAGTNFGVSRWDPGTERFRTVVLPAGFGPDISAMEFDTRGNLWLGASNGLARRDGTTGEIEVFTSLNSGLVNDVVRGICYDTLTSDLFIATGGGLSKLSTTIGVPTRNLDSIWAFPNPFVISSSADRLNFNFAGSGTIRIFTLAGEQVIEQSVNLPWDGRNSDGSAVASGVYLFVLNAIDGSVGRGKFLLVRK